MPWLCVLFPFFTFKFLLYVFHFLFHAFFSFPLLFFCPLSLMCSVVFFSFHFVPLHSPYSVFFLHSVLVNNAVHITRLSFLLFSAPWLDNCDSPGPERHQLRPADWSVTSHVSAREEFFIYFTSVENSFMSAFAAWLALFSLLSVIKNFAWHLSEVCQTIDWSRRANDC